MRRTRFAFVGCFSSARRRGHGTGIAVFEVTPDDEWRAIHTVPTAENPSFLVADNDGRHLYAAHGDSPLVSSYEIESTGWLRELGRYDTGGSNGVHLALSPDQRHLIVASFTSGSIAVLPRNPDGTLGPRVCSLVLTGVPGPIAGEQTGPQPHEVCIDPSGRHIVVPDRGTDRLHLLAFDPTTAQLTVAGPTHLSAPGSGPRHLLFHPSLPFMYVVDELSSHLTVYKHASADAELCVVQSLSTLPDGDDTPSAAAGIDFSRDTRFVYVSNRGHDSVASFPVLPNGMAGPPTFTKSGGAIPRFLRFAPDSDTLLVANQVSDNIIAFHADVGTGALTPTGQTIITGSPSCIEFVVG